MSASQSLPLILKAYLNTSLGQLHYRYYLPHPTPAPLRTSAPRSPILLLHMSASSSLSFTTLIRSLSTLGHPCYAPDMPGFGSSFSPTTSPPNIAWYASLYHTAFAQLAGFENGCHILGHHSGAIIGTELANGERYGGFVQSLTCVGPAVLSEGQRVDMARTFLDPFNRPVASGEHLLKTWEYLQWEGLSPGSDLELLHRETLDHVRAWKGRSQIYRCVWDFDCEEALGLVVDKKRVLGLCARDDVLWPYFEQFKAVGGGLRGEVIKGGNFGPDLDWEGILKWFVPFIDEIEL
ncbi:alpha/beta-hydrolase [Pleomassaria siparia CBS 279.74]|uniref:Alpha/beta-hydrolase n=1 Tax=Pleomassaria siparia CBS 279.74 TaxID=1314801 RepID=A0A6G1JTS6_9PLEO|nr:alpha/beta-hydrolase [Pleomassaria siparia CBS 279.74]